MEFQKEVESIERIYVEFVAKNIALGSTNYKLLMTALSALKELPLLLGHSRSRGLGWYRLSTAESRLVYTDLTKVGDLNQLLNVILNTFNYCAEVRYRVGMLFDRTHTRDCSLGHAISLEARNLRDWR